MKALLAGGWMTMVCAGSCGAADMPADAALAAERLRMVNAVVAMVRETARETGRATLAEPVLAALRRVERHRLVPPAERRWAYDNRPLPIGQGQTISQPYIVALSTDLVDPRPDHVVLEIGTGSGYQAALLAEVVREVLTIEIVEPLGRQAEAALGAMGYRNIRFRIGDGYRGWPERAPFDGIIVTAAAPRIPEALVEQLKPGGRMVIPVGPDGAVQALVLVEKQPDGRVARRNVLPVRFVPMTGDDARSP